jgi:hypothetical protein
MLSSTVARKALAANDLETATGVLGPRVVNAIVTQNLYGVAAAEQDDGGYAQMHLSAGSGPPDAERGDGLPTKTPGDTTVFISATSLSRKWKTIPETTVDSALFFFGSKRKWLFPVTEADRVEAKRYVHPG